MSAITFYQVVEFLSFRRDSEVLIDFTLDDQYMDANIDITFPFIPCQILSLDVEDITGTHVVNIEGQMNHHVLDHEGKEKNEKHDGLAKEGDNDPKLL